MLLALAAEGALGAQSLTTVPSESVLAVEHDPLPCLTTSTAPRLEASVSPPAEFSSGRVYWRVSNGPREFYYTVLTGTPPRLQALLPRVTNAADSIEYSIEVTDRTGRSRRTPAYVAPLVPATCIARGIIPVVKGLALTIGLTDPKQPRLPAGINRDDVEKVILVSGDVVPARGSQSQAAVAGPGAGTPPTEKRGGVSKGVLIGAGVLAAAAVAAAAGGGGGGGSKSSPGTNSSPTPTATPTPSPTATPVDISFRFVQAEGTWSGPGDVDVAILDASNQPVPGAQTFPAGCESTASRTERFVMQGSSLRAGTYRVQLTAKTCGPGTPTSISTLVTVQTDAGPKCSSTFVIVPVGQTVFGCTFTLP